MLRVFVLASFGVLFEWLNVFGIAHASHEASESVFLRAISFFYSERRRDEPVVVLYDENSLNELGMTWPVDFGTHAKLLHFIGRFGPRAVFFDIAFFQERSRKDDFIDEIRRQTLVGKGKSLPCRRDGRVPGTPVLLGTLSGREPLAYLCAAGAESVLVSWQSDPGHYPFLGCNALKDGTYQAQGCAPGDRRQMAATRLWHDWCRDKQLSPGSACPNGPDPPKLFSIVWGAGTDPHQSNFQPFGHACASKLEQLAAAAGLWRLDDGIEICPFPLTIPASVLLECEDKIKAASRCANQEWLQRALNRHIVIIAAELPGLRDLLPSPAHGLLPGVYTHAAALDNLLRRGENVYTVRSDYFEEGEPLLSWWHVGLLAALCVFLWTALRLVDWVKARSMAPLVEVEADMVVVEWPSRYQRRFDRLRDAAHAPTRPPFFLLRSSAGTLARLVLIALLVYGAALALALALFCGFQIAAINWAGFAVLVVTLCIPDIAEAAIYPLASVLLFASWGRRILCKFLEPPEENVDDDD